MVVKDGVCIAMVFGYSIVWIDRLVRQLIIVICYTIFEAFK